MKLLRTLLVALMMLVFSLPATAQLLTIDAGTVGVPASGARAELYLPAGKPPTAAVVVLHGCNGVSPHDRAWSMRLAEWEYAALLVDSFRPRGYADGVCNHGRDVSGETRAGDAFAAAAYLRSRPELRGARIGLIGFSHGGWAVLEAVLAAGITAAISRSTRLSFFIPLAFHQDRHWRPIP